VVEHAAGAVGFDEVTGGEEGSGAGGGHGGHGMRKWLGCKETGGIWRSRLRG
jgi:hypothetical protein